MKTAALLILLFAATAPAAALAQAPEAAPTVYPASFFAQFRSQNAYEMIERIPGFVYDEGQLGSRLLADAGNVLIDGRRPSLEGRSLSTELRDIPAGSVVRIELIREGATDIEMGGWPVLANVIVRRTGALRGTVRLSGVREADGRQGGSADASIQRRGERATLDISGDASRTPSGGGRTLRERVSALSGAMLDRELSDSGGFSERLDVRGGYDARLALGRVRLNAATTYTTSDTFGRDRDLQTGDVDRDGRQSDTRNQDMGARYTRAFGEQLDVDVRVSQSERDRRARSFSGNGDITYSSRSDSGDRSAAASLRYRPSDRLTLEPGVNAEFTWQGGSSQFFRNGQPIGVPSSSSDVDRLRVESYLEGIWEVLPTVTFSGGLVYDTATLVVHGDEGQEETFKFLRPTMEVTWSPNRRHEATLGVERDVQPINLSNFVSTVRRDEGEDEDEIIAGATELIPETEWALRFRYQHRFGREGVVSFNAVHTRLSDIVDRVLLKTSSGASFEAPGNIGGGRRDYLNLSVFLPLDPYGLGETSLRVSTTWRESELTDPFTGEPRRFSGETPFSWSLNLNTELYQGAVRAGVDASGSDSSVSYRRTELTLSQRDPYITAYVEYRPDPQLTARLEVRNMSDRLSWSRRELYGSGGRAGGNLSAIEERLSEDGPSIHINLRRSI